MIGKHMSREPIAVGAFSEKGSHAENQDRFRISPNGVVVCDGIGGLDAGGLYAEMAAWKIGDMLDRGSRSDSAVNGAAKLLAKFHRSNGIYGGTSASACSFNPDGSCSVSSCGDTRVYLATGCGLRPVSNPDVDPEGRLVDYLGIPSYRSWHGAETLPAAYMPGSTLLMVSDGVWKSVSEAEILAVCRDDRLSEQQKAVELVTRARQGLSTDDCTAVVCAVRAAEDHDLKEGCE